MGTSISTLKTTNDPSPFITNDLQRYIIETELPPGSGRMLRGYRVRSSECGVLLVCKATVLRYNEDTIDDRESKSQGDVIRQSISNNAEELKRIWELIGTNPNEYPNVLPYQRWMISSNPIRDSRSGLTSQPVYLMRQHCYATLSDRLALRPFLTIIEKTWIAYQILRALQAIHDIGVCHGHLTCENICVTSYGWVLLTDFGSVKPVCIPDYDLSHYILHFEKKEGRSTGGISTNAEKRCYLAPERFYSQESKTKPYTKLTPAMDIFSTGCVLIETLLNGEKALDIGDLMDYRKSKNGALVPSLKQKLNKIDSSSMRAACKHMLSLDPMKRLSASSYLTRLSTTNNGNNKPKLERRSSDDFNTNTVVAPIPNSFHDFLWPLMKKFRYDIYSPDGRIALLARSFGEALKCTVGIHDLEAERYFKDILGDDKELSISNHNESITNTPDESYAELLQKQNEENKESSIESWSDKFQSLLKDTEDLIRRLELENEEEDKKDEECDTANNKKATKVEDDNDVSNIDYTSASSCSLLIYIQMILSTIRFVQRPSSKIVALQLLSNLSKYCTDEARLQRIVPVVVYMLDDSDALVKATCVRVLTKTLERITSFPPSDAKLFQEYIFKRLSSLIFDGFDDKVVVKVAFSECISSLAETAKRFLDVNHAMRLYEAVGNSTTGTSTNKNVDGRNALGSSNVSTVPSDDIFPEFPDLLPCLGDKISSKALKEEDTIIGTYNNKNNVLLDISSYDDDLTSLQETISRWVVLITTDNSSFSNDNNRTSKTICSAPKRALLQDLTRLCSFFGRDGAISRILPQLLAFLNDRDDWELRSSLCRNLPSVCSIIGNVAVDQFVLPVIETALTDDNAIVIHSAMNCLRRLVKMGLLSRSIVLGVKRDEDKEPSSNFGIIEKYSPFLLHPSEVVRHGIASFICGCCQVFGYPDDKVFILPIIKPYIRYEPSSKDLQSVPTFLSCILPPVLQINPISKPNKKLLKSFWNTSTEEQKQLFYSTSAYTFIIPNQKYVEYINKTPLPDWFYFRYIFKEDKLKIKMKHLSIPFLIHVYGLLSSTLNTSLQQATIRKSKSHYGNNSSEDLQSFEIVQDNNELDVSNSLTNDNYQYLDSDEWGCVASLDPSLVDASMLLSKLKCLHVPPLPPRLGVLRTSDGKAFSCHGSPTSYTTNQDSNADTTTASSTNSTTIKQQTKSNKNLNWKPKKTNSLLLSTSQSSSHKGAVTRLAISQDHSFFVSSSYDGTAQVFELRNILDDRSVTLNSSLVYTGHDKARLNDVCIIENSHSVATADSNGFVHVWRVETTKSKDNDRNYYGNSRVSGNTLLRNINKKEEGEILSLSHFNTNSSSILLYATQMGSIHSWDLRCPNEPFTMKIRPELGYFTSMAIGSDRNWMVTGTSRGFLSLWDLRYQTMVKLWQNHSANPIQRLATCFTIFPFDDDDSSSPKPYIFMGCGLNEASVYDLTTATCKQAFRVLDPSLDYVDQSALPSSCLQIPYLRDVALPSHSSHRIIPALNMATQSSLRYRHAPPEPSITAIVGRLAPSSTFNNYLITGGTDRHIRYWDFTSPSNCYTISGLYPDEPRPTYESVTNHSLCQLFLCRQKYINPGSNTDRFATNEKNVSTSSVMNQSINHSHQDAILDLKTISYPMNALLSSSRDGTIKLWH